MNIYAHSHKETVRGNEKRHGLFLSMRVEVGGALQGIRSLLLPCESQAWQKALIATEPSHWPTERFCGRS